MIQFSVGKGTGIAIPFTYEYVSFIRRLCKSDNLKLGFNWWEFDAPRVRDAGVQVKGQVHDLMVMFSKFNPGLRKGLQTVASYAKFPFPWKHWYGTNLEWYGCADVDALHWIWEWLPGQMKQLGCWKQYKEQVYDYKTVLDRASIVGIPVDNEARVTLQSEMVSEATKRVQELEELIPIEIRAVAPKRKDEETGRVEEGYKKPPVELAELLIKYKRLKEKLEGEGKKVVEFAKFALRHGYVRRGKLWARLLPLKTSKEQVLRYIRWKKKELLKGE